MNDMYRLYVEDPVSRMWLTGWTLAEGIEHPQFSTFKDQALVFDTFESCLEWHRKLTRMGYRAHAI